MGEVISTYFEKIAQQWHKREKKRETGYIYWVKPFSTYKYIYLSDWEINNKWKSGKFEKRTMENRNLYKESSYLKIGLDK